jgi:predicted regulator of Ras-like GTPase activity (Roadblock/LC7/MglB family)
MEKAARSRHSATGTGIVHFSDEVLQKMDEALDALLDESKSRCAMVIDRTGCILSSAGDFAPLSQDNMGAVAAGVIAAINTMVARANSPEVSVKFYGSEIDKIHFVLLADRLILCMIHSRHTTTGQVRAAARSFANTMLPILAKDKASESQGANLAKSVQYIENKINEMFKDFT